MSDILTGLAIGLGIIGGIFFAILTLILAVLLVAEAQARRKQRKEKPAKPAPVKLVKLETLTDDQLRRRIRQSANELDLWLRAASLRDVDVDLTLARVDPDAIYPKGRTGVSVRL